MPGVWGGRHRVVIDRATPPPTRWDVAGRVTREAVLACLAFAAGFGGYMGQLKEPPREPQDYCAAIGAGALLALAKLVPGASGGGRG